MTYRNDIEALTARHAALEFEVLEKARERDVATRLLEEARSLSARPILDNIRIATPCKADWNQMTGDERVRLCGACNKHVYNLSNLTRDEAEALIVAKAGDLCARYYQRADGTILLADCELGRKRKQRKRLVAFGAMAMLAGGGVIAYKLSRPVARPRPLMVQGGAGDLPIADSTNPPPPDQMEDVSVTSGGVSFDPGEPPPVEVKGNIAVTADEHPHLTSHKAPMSTRGPK